MVHFFIMHSVFRKPTYIVKDIMKAVYVDKCYVS